LHSTSIDAIDGSTKIDQLLAQCAAGDSAAWQEVVKEFYQPLRKLARAQLGHQPKQLTLETTGLVHEWYLQMAQSSSVTINNRGHFFALAARVMRQVISTYAKRRLSEKRGAGQTHALLSEPGIRSQAESLKLTVDQDAEQFSLLEDALQHLAAQDPSLVEIVHLKFYLGMSEQQIADTQGISLRSVQRMWQRARAFLLEEINT
jgi:RNA polymerase sigma factor (TIGR02999 family)